MLRPEEKKASCCYGNDGLSGDVTLDVFGLTWCTGGNVKK
jgi:hypothetical protein